MSRLPETFNATGLRTAGFEGFQSVASLRATKVASVPREAGVYVVLRESAAMPRFLPEGTGGRFKGKDPNAASMC